MDTFKQLQALVLVAVAMLVAPMALPALRPHARLMRLAALVVYVGGALAILLYWLIKGD
jgi:hypothetical protein